MAIKTRDILKNLFKTGDKPNQAAFADWLDSFWHKSEIPISDYVKIGSLEFAGIDELDEISGPAVTPGHYGLYVADGFNGQTNMSLEVRYVSSDGTGSDGDQDFMHIIRFKTGEEYTRYLTRENGGGWSWSVWKLTSSGGGSATVDADTVDTAIGGYSTVTTIADDEKIVVKGKKLITLGSLKTLLTTAFNNLYAAINHNHSYTTLSDKPTIPSIAGLAVESELVGENATKFVKNAENADFAYSAGTANNALLDSTNRNIAEAFDYFLYSLGNKEDAGTAAELISTHNSTFSHSDIAGNTAARHSHSNKSVLDSIQEALTTALKTAYDNAVTHAGSAHAPSDAEKNDTAAQIKSKLETLGYYASKNELTPTTIVIFKNGINGNFYPRRFKWPTNKTISAIQLMSNCTDISITIGAETYDKITAIDVLLPANSEMTINDLTINAGFDYAEALIIF